MKTLGMNFRLAKIGRLRVDGKLKPPGCLLADAPQFCMFPPALN
jgi:hypothetical protein